MRKELKGENRFPVKPTDLTFKSKCSTFSIQDQVLYELWPLLWIIYYFTDSFYWNLAEKGTQNLTASSCGKVGITK